MWWAVGAMDNPTGVLRYQSEAHTMHQLDCLNELEIGLSSAFETLNNPAHACVDQNKNSS